MRTSENPSPVFYFILYKSFLKRSPRGEEAGTLNCDHFKHFVRSSVYVFSDVRLPWVGSINPSQFSSIWDGQKGSDSQLCRVLYLYFLSGSFSKAFETY